MPGRCPEVARSLERLLLRIRAVADLEALLAHAPHRAGGRDLLTGPLVRESVYYVHVDPALHRALFGELPPDR